VSVTPFNPVLADGVVYRDQWEYQQRMRVLEQARKWIGTPFEDKQRCLKAGVDCAMLVVAVYEDAGVTAPVAVPEYSPQWHLHHREEKFLNEIRARCAEVTVAQVLPGDIALFKIGRTYAHGAIIVRWPTVIHAMYGVCVMEARADQHPLLEYPYLLFSPWRKP
jgi:cell wall-associated NlpC family hydrolase